VRIVSVVVALLVPAPILAACAFGDDAPTPAAAEQANGPATLALDQRGAVGGVAVTPFRIEEDSRCPSEVVCVQAGTVRVALHLEDGATRRDTVLTLAEPLGLDGGRWLTLAAVCPYPRHPGTIAPASYRFTFALDQDGAGRRPDVGCAP
jgi:hypothetical protein